MHSVQESTQLSWAFLASILQPLALVAVDYPLMWLGVVPSLTHGSFARFYGGLPILPMLSKSPQSPLPSIWLASSLLFQLSVAVFKKILKEQQDSSESVVKQLRDIVLAGFSNVYSVCSILLFTVTFSIWQGFKLTEGPEKVKEKLKEVEEDEVEEIPRENPRLPSTIIGFALLLFVFNILQFYRNNALRAFSFKRTKLLVLSLWKDDRPRRSGEDVSNKVTLSSGEREETSQNPGIGDIDIFQAASTSRAHFEAGYRDSVSQRGILIHSIKFEEESLGSDISQMPDVSC